jgi:uncharacterized protein YndB with AHSA1/START domain
MSDRKTEHATFVIERTFTSAPAQVFAAWADVKAKARWFKGPEAWTEKERTLDFRVGGRERLVGSWQEGKVSTFDATYRDIVPDERIVYVYDMQVNGTPISSSLATVEFRSKGAGTLMKFTEQAAFLDDFDDAGGRERGTRLLLDNLEAALQRETA